jgi:AcrR family transcriptional regulator
LEEYNIRITKNPEERRKELIDIAEQLFIKKGYEQTAVSDIVNKAKVAQGTFYYYFKTKEEILDEIIDRYITLTVEGIQKIANEKGPNAIDKLVNIFLFSSSFRNDRKSIMQYLHEDRNAHLHQKFERKIPSGTVGPLSQIIQQGIDEGLFKTQYPIDAANAFIGVTAMVLRGIDSADKQSEEFIRKFMATFDFLERIFGAECGSILRAYEKKAENMESE